MTIRSLLVTVLAVLMLMSSTSRGGDADTSVAEGRTVFARVCMPCHGPRMPATLLLDERYQGAVPGLIDERTDLTADAVEVALRDGVGSMPPFSEQSLSASDMQALIRYLTRSR